MPSASGRPSRLAWLRSQGLGLACGFAVVLLLAVGSLVLAATREGASAGVGMDDLRGFFERPAAAHAWLYLLFPVAALYALNTTLATWDTVSRRWRAGVRTLSAYAGSVFHVGFLLAMAAHGVGGFWGADGGGAVLSVGWQELPGFGEARLLSLDVEALPGGMPKTARARVEVRDPAGAVREETLGYNAPLSVGAGARLALLSDLGRVRVARLASGGAACAAVEGQGCALAGERVDVLAFSDGPGGAVALVRASGPSGGREVRWLAPDAELILAGGRPLQLEGVTVEPAVAVRVRETPGTPLALAAAIATAVGVVLLWRRLAPRGRLAEAGE